MPNKPAFDGGIIMLLYKTAPNRIKCAPILGFPFIFSFKNNLKYTYIYPFELFNNKCLI